MQMIARIRVVVDVPFEFDVVELNTDPNVDNDPQVYESRQSAADYAVSDVVPQVTSLVNPAGEITDSSVEEVREADVS